jgi:hypothetical protein
MLYRTVDKITALSLQGLPIIVRSNNILRSQPAGGSRNAKAGWVKANSKPVASAKFYPTIKSHIFVKRVIFAKLVIYLLKLGNPECRGIGG